MYRLKLNKNIDPDLFLEMYYLKKELLDFCKNNRLSVQGNKNILTQRIYYFLKTGNELNKKKIVTVKIPSSLANKDITLDSIIEVDFKCTEHRRNFFKQKLGNHFKFIVPFQKWLKENYGKTYKEAIDAYKIIKNDHLPKSIDPQFKYNTYIRDFFKENKNLSLKEAIICWNYKKNQRGMQMYHQSDLKVLDTHT